MYTGTSSRTTSVSDSHDSLTITVPVFTAARIYLLINSILGISTLNCLLRIIAFCLAASTSLYVTGLTLNISSVDRKGSSRDAYLHSACFLITLG